MKCEFCETSEAEVEGWFYAVARNEFNHGTVAAGLLHNKVACRPCAQKAIDSGMAKAKELP